MDVTISFNEVTTLLGVIPTLEPRPNFEHIRVLRQHFKRTLQRLPCPQSTLHGWKGMMMARELYTLLTPTPFRLPTNPVAHAVYVWPINRSNTGVIPDPAVPLTRTEQTTIDTMFSHHKHHYQCMLNIKCACFTALDASINVPFQVSNNPTIQGWHVRMSKMVILNQLSLYGHPTPAVLKQNDCMYCSPYLAANPPEVLFQCIQDCAEIALLRHNPYMDCQLINNMICLLLTMGLYLQPFEDWDLLLPQTHTRLALRTMIQESFQQRLNATAPTAGHHGYAPAQPYLQNAFGVLEEESDNGSIVASVATQVAALTHQSQLTSSNVSNTSQRHDNQLAHIAAQQDLMHQNMHQIITALNAVRFNVHNEGCGIRRYAGRQARRRGHPLRGQGCGPPMYALSGIGYNPGGGYTNVGGYLPTRPPGFFPPSPQLGFPGGPTGGHIVSPVAMTQPAYRTPLAASPPGFKLLAL
jgi:hypothetical protein